MIRKTTITIWLLLGFILGIQDGYIALWEDGKDQPRVFPYRAEMLPEPDQRRLEKGIRIPDDGKLAQILEDYLS